MGAGGGHPGEVIKVKVVSIGSSAIVLEMAHEDTLYFKVGKSYVANFRPADGGEHQSGPDKAASA
jgi:hypothetical protein